uniref:RAP domain-containing protein n=1 Tax=Chromera velia CCMP2878 TaxID=1169474 RepID=A0A0G4HAC5_9ALVE|eukprot:Cvel_6028.t1-p1 / transcript=Cvel_6028.t1 / gene=Cvel_6028 / organism=Chromera_velia_CCMP2878 / gene_product=hypothetical protein / transcript_product=hypothetical protein / location=Cvel_scaffold289:30322-36522(-) / protein_length=884 / sequence_SO=supercontig / SO=protein_coding / is_pseudo=false
MLFVYVSLSLWCVALCRVSEAFLTPSSLGFRKPEGISADHSRLHWTPQKKSRGERVRDRKENKGRERICGSRSRPLGRRQKLEHLDRAYRGGVDWRRRSLPKRTQHQTSPETVIRELSGATSPSEVLTLFESYPETLTNHFRISLVAFTRMAATVTESRRRLLATDARVRALVRRLGAELKKVKLARRESPYVSRTGTARRGRLDELREMENQKSVFTTPELTTFFWALGRIGFQESREIVELSCLHLAARLRSGELTVDQTVDILCSLSDLRTTGQSLAQEALSALEKRLQARERGVELAEEERGLLGSREGMGGKQLTRVLSAIAKLGLVQPEFVKAALKRLRIRMRILPWQDVLDLTEALRKMEFHDPTFLAAAARNLRPHLPKIARSRQAVLRMLFAFADLGFRPPVLLEELGERILKKFNEWPVENLAQVVRLYALMGCYEPRELFIRTFSATDWTSPSPPHEAAGWRGPGLPLQTEMESEQEGVEEEDEEETGDRDGVRVHEEAAGLHRTFSGAFDKSAWDLACMKIFQTYVGFKVESAESLLFDMDEDAYEHLRKKYTEQQEDWNFSSSGIHKEIAQVLLERLRVPNILEFVTPEGLTIDLAVFPEAVQQALAAKEEDEASGGRPLPELPESPREERERMKMALLASGGRGGEGKEKEGEEAPEFYEKIAIEVDGPGHFLSKSGDAFPPLPTGKTSFKRRLLEKSGWHVISIPFWEWKSWQSRELRAAYLKSKLPACLFPSDFRAGSRAELIEGDPADDADFFLPSESQGEEEGERERNVVLLGGGEGETREEGVPDETSSRGAQADSSRGDRGKDFSVEPPKKEIRKDPGVELKREFARRFIKPLRKRKAPEEDFEEMEEEEEEEEVDLSVVDFSR